jgi:penicillin-binding protein 1A
VFSSVMQLSASLGDEALFTGGLTIRATVDPALQQVAAQALRDGLERYDRGTRIYRGPVALVDPASWFRSLSERSPIELIYRAPALRRIQASAGR